MQMKLWRWLMKTASLFLFLASMVSCSATKKEVIGTYYAQFPAGSERLEVMANGRYKQVITMSATGETLVREGAWDFNLQEGELVLEKALDYPIAPGEPSRVFPPSDNVRFGVSRTHWLYGQTVLMPWTTDYQMHRVP
jgi:hypothetical protein